MDPQPVGPISGLWRSQYEFYSSSRRNTFVSQHTVLVVQLGNRLSVRSVPGSASSLMMDLTIEGPIVTGTWDERTEKDGHYAGARYFGAVQMLLYPTGRRMSGKWVGFGKESIIHSGPWELLFNPDESVLVDTYSPAQSLL